MQGISKLPHQAVLRLAWPMILSNISVPLLGVVDTAILGHLPEATYLGAVAVGASILSIVFWAAGFLRMGTTSLVSQATGRKDEDEVQALLIRSGVIALTMGLLLICLQKPLFDLALWLMGPTKETLHYAYRYSVIRIYAAPAVLLNLVIVGWFIGRQNALAPLLIMVSTNLINVVLDMLLIWGLKMNSDGAALATLCADYLGCALGIALVLRAAPGLVPKIKTTAFSAWQEYRRLLFINQNLFIRTCTLLATMGFFTAQGAQMGNDILAANAILFQLMLLTAYGLDGIAHAAEALSGKAVGGGNHLELRRVIVTSGLWSLIIAVAMTLVFVVGKQWLIPFFTDIESVVAALNRFYVWIYFLPLLSFAAYWLDGIYIGIGATKAMRNWMLFSCLVVFLPLWWLTNDWSNHGLWLAFTSFNLARGVTLALALPALVPTNQY